MPDIPFRKLLLCASGILIVVLTGCGAPLPPDVTEVRRVLHDKNADRLIGRIATVENVAITGTDAGRGDMIHMRVRYDLVFAIGYEAAVAAIDDPHAAPARHRDLLAGHGGMMALFQLTGLARQHGVFEAGSRITVTRGIDFARRDDRWVALN